MFSKGDRVTTTRSVRAGLKEDGPTVCPEGIEGVVLEVDAREPDGIHVRLVNGSTWWFKLNQLKK
jgi:hypothetical protein